MPIANKIKRLLGWEATRTEPMAEKKAKELIQIRYNPSTGVSGNDRRLRGAAWLDSSHAERWLLLITATLGRLGARNFRPASLPALSLSQTCSKRRVEASKKQGRSNSALCDFP